MFISLLKDFNLLNRAALVPNATLSVCLLCPPVSVIQVVGDMKKESDPGVHIYIHLIRTSGGKPFPCFTRFIDNSRVTVSDKPVNCNPLPVAGVKSTC